MSLILNIDTAQETAQVSLAENGKVLLGIENREQRDHAAFVQPAVKDLFSALNRSMNELSAVAICLGPGSYTGLRVGMASAKGICYALKVPLIGVGTLEVMALGAQHQVHDVDLWCPMIDARRQEVYTAIYDKSLNEVLAPQAMILQTNSLSDFIKNFKILFFGSGSFKWEKIYLLDHDHNHSIFKNILIDYFPLANLSHHYYLMKHFINLAYAEPLYLKDFHHSPANLKTQ